MKQESMRKAYADSLLQFGEDPRVVVLDADLSASTQTVQFAKKYPDRFFNAGCAEQNMMGISAGLAHSGKKVFASTFAMFATGRPWEQIRNSIAYDKLDVNIVATHAGLTVGGDGASHQALEDIAIMRAIPNMQVLVPADAKETSEILKYSYENPGPKYIRLCRVHSDVLFDDSYKFTGKASVLKQGKQVTLIACGLMVSESLKAAELLEEQGISAGVTNMSSLKSIDQEAVQQAASIGPIATIEEHNIIGGLGCGVAGALSEKPVPLKRIGVKDAFGQSGSPLSLWKKHGLTAEKIADTINNWEELK